ncbi:DUF2157 domain-containing protein [Aliidiomarina quisquiliarum]|uniref:DUF2157 domain-containing protein n=1 Tax=Aliidiomarina quisquiliarum TaxID=2938947 RepID=UPI00208F7D15|nr:DUF2157 domain-containing protein [Aliidiomarina quisquiliarum]MCO4320700.1 DUF2157 domain-containing protein [Aliidiomarina quisquiliarum]
MKLTQRALKDAVQAGVLSAQQAEDLAHFLAQQRAVTPTFTFSHLLYYLGGFLAMGAMMLLLGLGWESFGAPWIVLLSIFYSLIGLFAMRRLLSKHHLLPAGICAAFLVCLTPITIYGSMQWAGIWPKEQWVNGSWHAVLVQLSAVLTAAVLLRKYKLPFITLPLAVACWFLSVELVAFVFHDANTWNLQNLVSLYCGLILILSAFMIELRTTAKADYAFWFYMVGGVAFWWGLTFQVVDDDFSKHLYFIINLITIVVGVLLVRRVFVVLGVMGTFGYFNYLAFDVFRSNWAFVIVLTAVGLGLIYLGVLWQKHEKEITQKARAVLPRGLQKVLDKRERY